MNMDWFTVIAHMPSLQVRKERFSSALSAGADEVDPRTRELLENFPQAFSHIGLVNAAWAIMQTSGQEIVNRHMFPHCPNRPKHEASRFQLQISADQ